MAYNAANEERKDLFNIAKGTRGDAVVGTKITNKNTGTVNIDIRQYYTNNDGELAPTSKGVRFNAENLLEVVIALVNVLEGDELVELSEVVQTILDTE